jgi:CRP-like cAMP-binding protein
MSTSPLVSASSSSITHHTDGGVIAEEGSPSIGWYVLLSGRVGVFKQSAMIAEFSKRGEVFGEIGSILRQPRSARLVALEDTSVAYFNCDLDELISLHPKVARTMLVSLARRLVKTTDDLWSARAE